MPHEDVARNNGDRQATPRPKTAHGSHGAGSLGNQSALITEAPSPIATITKTMRSTSKQMPVSLGWEILVGCFGGHRGTYPSRRQGDGSNRQCLRGVRPVERCTFYQPHFRPTKAGGSRNLTDLGWIRVPKIGLVTVGRAKSARLRRLDPPLCYCGRRAGVFLLGVAVGHAGQVISDAARPATPVPPAPENRPATARAAPGSRQTSLDSISCAARRTASNCGC